MKSSHKKDYMKFRQGFLVGTAFLFSKLGLLTKNEYQNVKFNMKFLMFFLVLLVIPFAMGAECTSTPVEDCTLESNTYYEFDGGTYYLNDTNKNGAIRVNGDNIVLNCNGTTIVGNWTDSETLIYSRAFYGENRNNITIKNCIIQGLQYGIRFHDSSNLSFDNVTYLGNMRIGDYMRGINGISITNSNFSGIYTTGISSYGIGFDTSQSKNVLIQNNQFDGNSTSYVYTSGVFGSNNITIKDNIFNDGYRPLYLIDLYNVTIQNNSFINSEQEDFYLDSGQVWDIKDNYFTSSSTIDIGNIYNISDILFHNNNYSTYNKAFKIEYTENLSFYDNNFYDATSMYGVYFRLQNNNIYIYNNTFDTNDRAIFFAKGTADNVQIYDNTFKNSIRTYDAWASALTVKNDKTNYSQHTNFHIYNNSFIDFGCVGIIIRDMNGIIIEDNYFSQNLTYLLSSTARCHGEPFTAIMFEQTFKGYVPIGTNSTDNYTVVSPHTSNNITISNNNFTNVNIKLRLQKVTNITHDITDYWYVAWRDVIWADKDEYYISNDYSNLTGIEPAGSISSIFEQGNAINGNDFEYMINSDYYYFENVNSSSRDLIIYSLTNALITISDGTEYTYVTGSQTITLEPGEYAYVYDEYYTASDLGRMKVDSGICGSLSSGVDNIGSKIPIVLSIASIILLLTILGGLFIVYNGGSFGGADISVGAVIAIIFAIVGIIVVSIIGMVITSAVCAI